MRRVTLHPGARIAILAWFDERGRSLPFRASRDPYGILVSEVMAQQTQIARVSERWPAFMAAFPTVGSLARASTADVLRAWRGMGYNRRALNLQRAARAILHEHAGTVPSEVEALQRLPGVGPYTARAVAALAFGRAVGPVDTNVRRVIGRMTGRDRASDLQRIADDAVPPSRPVDWTHALMDLGATICRPAKPRCDACPARPWCRSAGTAPRPRAAAGRRAEFTSTTRWLRGRILDRLRDRPADGWWTIEAPLGVHDEPAVEVAVERMEAEGLLERRPGRPRHIRLAR
jgi:A/G-specific adenine glycosylase